MTDEQRLKTMQTLADQTPQVRSAINRVLDMANVKKLIDELARVGYLSETDAEQQFIFYQHKIHGRVALALCDNCQEAFNPDEVRYAASRGKFVCTHCAIEFGIPC